MATTYASIFDAFLDEITDPEMLLLSEDLREDYLTALMNKAITRCSRVCSNVDLVSRNDDTGTFDEDIPAEVIEIIVAWMLVFWLQPYVNNLENLQNRLSTKDFTVFSPANLLEKMSAWYEICRHNARRLMNHYSYIISDVSELQS